MAVVEQFNSRKMHITDEGTVLTQFFKATAEDWAAADPAIPKVGDVWPDRTDLVVTDVWQTWLDNVNTMIEVVYSTIGGVFKGKRANKSSGVKDDFNFSLTVEDGSQYVDQVSGDATTWSVVWAAADPSATEDNAAPLSIFKPALTVTRTMYLTTWDFNDIAFAIGKINNSDWLKQTKIFYSGIIPFAYDVTGDDTGKWLFSGYDAVQVGIESVQVTMEFIYNFDGWNNPYGVAANLYSFANFNGLPFPVERTDVPDNSLRGS